MVMEWKLKTELGKKIITKYTKYLKTQQSVVENEILDAWGRELVCLTYEVAIILLLYEKEQLEKLCKNSNGGTKL